MPYWRVEVVIIRITRIIAIEIIIWTAHKPFDNRAFFNFQITGLEAVILYQNLVFSRFKLRRWRLTYWTYCSCWSYHWGNRTSSVWPYWTWLNNGRFQNSTGVFIINHCWWNVIWQIMSTVAIYLSKFYFFHTWVWFENFYLAFRRFWQPWYRFH